MLDRLVREARRAACYPLLLMDPFETALRAKVHELFGEAARLEAGRTHDGEPLLEIRTVLGLEDAESRLRVVEGWMLEHYPDDDTVVGLLHVHHLSPDDYAEHPVQPGEFDSDQDDLLALDADGWDDSNKPA